MKFNFIQYIFSLRVDFLIIPLHHSNFIFQIDWKFFLIFDNPKYFIILIVITLFHFFNLIIWESFFILFYGYFLNVIFLNFRFHFVKWFKFLLFFNSKFMNSFMMNYHFHQLCDIFLLIGFIFDHLTNFFLNLI